MVIASFLTYYGTGTKLYPLLNVVFLGNELLGLMVSEEKNGLKKRMEKLGSMAVEIVNMLATRKVDGETINVADVYFILSRALEHVSLLNLTEIEEHKQRISRKPNNTDRHRSCNTHWTTNS